MKKLLPRNDFGFDGKNRRERRKAFAEHIRQCYGYNYKDEPPEHNELNKRRSKKLRQKVNQGRPLGKIEQQIQDDEVDYALSFGYQTSARTA